MSLEERVHTVFIFRNAVTSSIAHKALAFGSVLPNAIVGAYPHLSIRVSCQTRDIHVFQRAPTRKPLNNILVTMPEIQAFRGSDKEIRSGGLAKGCDARFAHHAVSFRKVNKIVFLGVIAP